MARAAIAAGYELALTPVELVFLYLPFEHSESLADQDQSVALFATLHDAVDSNGLNETFTYAERHRDVIRRFGRFPHRNAALGRSSTVEETAWLAVPGNGF